MKILKSFGKTLLWLVGILIVLALINRWYLGGFTKIAVQEQNMGAYTIAYVNFTGAYSSVGPSMDKVYTVLSGVGITSYTGVGIYYDDPAVVSGKNLRSDIGAIIDSKDAKKLLKNSDIKTKTMTAKQSVVITFPLKNSVSYMAGVIKVYPVLKKYMQEKGYTMEVPVTEFYDIAAKKIYYIVEIVK